MLSLLLTFKNVHELHEDRDLSGLLALEEFLAQVRMLKNVH